MKDLTKTAGAAFPPGDWNQYTSEPQNLIESSDQTLSGADLEQSAKGTEQYTSVNTFGVDTGVANAYLVTTSSPYKTPHSLSDGLEVEFVPVNSNSGASTLSAFGLGNKDLTYFNGAALVGGELLAGSKVKAFYDEDFDRYLLSTPSAVNASELLKGIFKFSTQEELTAGGNDQNAITPLKLKNFTTDIVYSVFKNSDQSVTNSIDLVDDDQLGDLIPLESDAYYVLDMLLLVETSSGFRFTINDQYSDFIANYFGQFQDNINGDSANVERLGTEPYSQVVTMNPNTGSYISAIDFRGIISTPSSVVTNLPLKWAQGSANAVPTTIKKGSFVRLTKIGTATSNNIYINASDQEVDLLALYELSFPPAVSGQVVNFHIAEGLQFGSDDAGVAAIRHVGWAAGVEVNLYDATIAGGTQGAFGKGGDGGDDVVPIGSAGGTALYLRSPIIIHGDPQYAGGGGGGNADFDSGVGPWKGGGGGAGKNVGLGGVIDGPNDGAAGTLLLGGAGQNDAGNGGNLGQVGGTSPSVGVPSDAGYSIDGYSYATFTGTPTLIGPTTG